MKTFNANNICGKFPTYASSRRNRRNAELRENKLSKIKIKQRE